MRALALTLAPLVLVAGGCAKPWQAARTIVNESADAIADADAAMLAHYEQSECEGNEDVDELTDCVEMLEEWSEALELARAAAIEGESIVDLWQAAQTEPGDWRGWVTASASLVANLIALLSQAGIDLPGEVVSISETLARLLEGGR